MESRTTEHDPRNLKVSRSKKSVFSVDGDSGLGLVVAPLVMDMVIENEQKNMALPGHRY